jgi:hypothetical protein
MRELAEQAPPDRFLSRRVELSRFFVKASRRISSIINEKVAEDGMIVHLFLQHALRCMPLSARNVLGHSFVHAGAPRARSAKVQSGCIGSNQMDIDGTHFDRVGLSKAVTSGDKEPNLDVRLACPVNSFLMAAIVCR